LLNVKPARETELTCNWKLLVLPKARIWVTSRRRRNCWWGVPGSQTYFLFSAA